MKALRVALALAFAVAPSFGVTAQTPIHEAAVVFGKREAVLDMSLSPDGQKIAYIASVPEASEVLVVIDLANGGEPVPLSVFDEPNGELVSCDWATNERLLCNYHFIEVDVGVPVGFSRVFSVEADGSDFTVITERDTSRALGIRQFGGGLLALDHEGKENRILMTKQWVKEYSTMTRTANAKSGLGVESVNVRTGKRLTVEDPDVDAVSFIADENGRVRLKATQMSSDRGNLESERRFYFRPEGSYSWEPLTEVQLDSQTYEGFYPVAVDSAKNVAYAFGNSGGYEALYTIQLVKGGQPQLLLARNDADVDGLIRIGRQARVVGASYATEKRQVVYFDEELKQLAGMLRDALPSKPLINIIDASADERKLLLVAASDTNPGMTYLYDKDALRLEPLLPLREHMSGREMGKMTPVTFTARDGTEIPGYLTLPPTGPQSGIGAIVLPHGGPSARDEWGFDWLVQFFAARGYAVLQPNFRGSSGYGAEWFGRNGFQAWETAVEDVNDAGRWLIAKGIADPEKIAVIGWSYGGYAALQSQVLDPNLYKAVGAIAPVTDLQQLKDESRRYTSSRLVKDFVGSGPHITEGSPSRHADSFAAPVILFHGTYDQNVDVAQSRTMHDRLGDAGRQVKYFEFEGEDHSLDNEQVRYDMLKEIDAFLSAHLGG